MLVAMVVIAGLMFWSVVLDAPLEEMANPTVTPNPAKAPCISWGFRKCWSISTPRSPG